ncbi:MAG: hypothetical protein HSCHL_1183 [Hydrogenibacillus schlegelii]|uniref:Uncharacterized protein n=1 Tax=Hydrogenibacillus schlegelii TaxID=1484 RepID=A0A2T5G6H9_HYDSH|nr:hypothetical protein [Hydrogenibacillus schlegelii]PTQ51779.1 MAG: hypothetical protein HSCHL_1183 [Hydrogenibacillus schlegelii]
MFAIEEKRTWVRGGLVWIVARKEGRSAEGSVRRGGSIRRRSF